MDTTKLGYPCLSNLDRTPPSSIWNIAATMATWSTSCGIMPYINDRIGIMGNSSISNPTTYLLRISRKEITLNQIIPHLGVKYLQWSHKPIHSDVDGSWWNIYVGGDQDSQGIKKSSRDWNSLKLQNKPWGLWPLLHGR